MADRNADPAASRDLSPGSVVLGRYTVQKVLGRGGMATVYLAKHQQTERLVALKLLDKEISRDPSYIERFRREARAAGRIRSDYVVAIYDLDAEVGGGLVLVMEYLEGQTVQQALRSGRMQLSRVLSFGRHLLDGLAAAHEAGVIHRDLKPANLFIERSSTGGEKLKILDFGISKLADASQQELTRDGQTIGTVAYMAPEQIRGKVSATDPRVDLYAAGVSLFLMLTGKRPIDAEDTVQLLAAVLETPPLTLAQAAGVPFPAPLEAYIAKALQKDPARRFQTALEMRDALLEAGRSIGHETTGPLQLPSAPMNPGMPLPLAPGGGLADPTPSGVRSAASFPRQPTTPPVDPIAPTLFGAMPATPGAQPAMGRPGGPAMGPPPAFPPPPGAGPMGPPTGPIHAPQPQQPSIMLSGSYAALPVVNVPEGPAPGATGQFRPMPPSGAVTGLMPAMPVESRPRPNKHLIVALAAVGAASLVIAALVVSLRGRGDTNALPVAPQASPPPPVAQPTRAAPGVQPASATPAPSAAAAPVQPAAPQPAAPQPAASQPAAPQPANAAPTPPRPGNDTTATTSRQSGASAPTTATTGTRAGTAHTNDARADSRASASPSSGTTGTTGTTPPRRRRNRGPGIVENAPF